MLQLPTPYERGQARPEQVDMDLGPGEDRAFLEGCAGTALQGVGSEPQRRAIALLKYVTSTLNLKAHGGTATAILRDGHAICAGMSRVFCALCRVSGLPCRDVSLFGLRDMGSHVMAEVYYDDAWHLFDPTFGLFFLAEDRRLCTLHDMICNPDAGEMFCVVPKPWQGFDQAAREHEPAPAPADFMKHQYGFGLPERYREWFSVAYPVTYRQAATSFPVRVDLAKDVSLEYVSADQAPEGACNRIGIDPETGWMSVGFAFCHTLLITAPAGRSVSLEYHFTDSAPELETMGLTGVRVLERTLEGNLVSFVLHCVEEQAVAMVSARTFGRVTAIKARLSADGGE